MPLQTQPLGSALKTLALLEAIAESGSGVRISDLARRVGALRGTVYQQLVTLVAAGWMERREDGTYCLTLRAARIGHAALEQASLGERVIPNMERLAAELSHTVSLAIADRDAALIVQRVEPGRVLRSDLRVGTRMPMARSASGRVLAAFATGEDLAAMRTDGVSIPAEADLKAIRARRYEVSNSGSFQGIMAVAVPIFAADRRCLAALSVSSHAGDLDVQHVANALRFHARDISRMVSGQRTADFDAEHGTTEARSGATA